MNTYQKYVVGFFALLLSLVICSCSSLQISADDAGMSEADYQTAMVVYERLGQDSITSQYSFNVVADSGVVTLSGWVDNPQARWRAINIAKGALSVQAVVDRMSR